MAATLACLASLGAAAAGLAQPLDVAPSLTPAAAPDWDLLSDTWAFGEGELEQTSPTGSHLAFLRDPVLADVDLSCEFTVANEGDGVHAAMLFWRSTGSRTRYHAHYDCRNRQVILVRTTPADEWIEITRRGGLPLEEERPHTARITHQGRAITLYLDGVEVLRAEDDTLRAGTVGLGTSQGRVRFRNLHLAGTAGTLEEEWTVEQPPWRFVCEDAGAGGYEAFPDVCRLQSGELMAVCYAGYGHVSLPTEALPRGGRICAVTSDDDGRTWGDLRIVYDGPADDRDPHLAQLSDGTLVCTFFSLSATEGGGYRGEGSWLVRSTDGGRTWDEEPTLISGDWYLSAPVRELPGGTLLLGMYQEEGGQAWGGVARSEEGGRTWGEPVRIPSAPDYYLDAEADVLRLPDGRLFAALRSSKTEMAGSWSTDEGRTWSEATSLGFPGHCPYLLRHSSGVVLLAHRVPATSLHLSRDDCRTWEGPFEVDTVGGAYPSLAELPDGTVLCVYYEEGEGSSIRCTHLRVTPEGVEVMP